MHSKAIEEFESIGAKPNCKECFSINIYLYFLWQEDHY